MFDWDDYLGLAERLAQDSGDEPALRSAISRAYYSAYHAAARFVRERGLLVGSHSHLAVWRAVAEQAGGAGSRLGVLGHRLKESRIEADYRTPFRGDPHKRARAAIIDARIIVEGLQSRS